MSENSKTDSALLRLLPSVDRLLKTETARGILKDAGAKRLTETARAAVEDLRAKITTENGDLTREQLLNRAEVILKEKFETANLRNFWRVINATDVVIITNL